MSRNVASRWRIQFGVVKIICLDMTQHVNVLDRSKLPVGSRHALVDITSHFPQHTYMRWLGLCEAQARAFLVLVHCLLALTNACFNSFEERPLIVLFERQRESG